LQVPINRHTCAVIRKKIELIPLGEFMKTKLLVCFFAIATCLAPTLSAQANRTNTQIVDFILNVQEKAVVDMAEIMPAEKYDFAPTSGEFKGVRTFAEQLKHIAADNYLLGAGILGEKPPGDVSNDERGSSSVRTKAEIVAYLKESFAYMHRAAAAIDDAKAPIPTPAISPWPDGTATRLGVAIEDCVHTWDHYGQLVEYLRMNGIVPPGSGAPTKANAPGPTSTKPDRTTMTESLDFWISNCEKEVVEAADAMPEEKYSFAPSGGRFFGVRIFAQQVKHLAANNYRMAARMTGEQATPDQESEAGPDDVRSKAQIMEYVRGSFAALHRAVATVTAENALDPVFAARVSTISQNTRLQFAIDAVAHSYDHYGQMVEYLRMNGIIPPASR
jgi:uncharacterized damage-inducible protein DinB